MQHQIISLEKQDAWQAFGGTWQYGDGVMTNNSDERGAKLMTGPDDWTNYSVEADVLLLGQYGDAGLIIPRQSRPGHFFAWKPELLQGRNPCRVRAMGKGSILCSEYSQV